MNDFLLHNGIRVPCIGFGTWQIGDAQSAITTVKQALESGYRHFDTASAYGNELSIGKALRECEIPRNELFISGKLWNTKRGYETTLTAFRQTLKRLKLDYLDLYLIHWPASPKVHDDWKKINADTWRAFEKLYIDGLVKSIGICNFMPYHMSALMENAEISPMTNQIEFHPGYLQRETIAFCMTNGIQVEAWSPLGSGRLLEQETLKSLAEKFNKSVAQICIKWCIQNNILPLPKSVNAHRMKENLNIDDFIISQEDMNRINSIPDCGCSGIHPDEIRDELF